MNYRSNLEAPDLRPYFKHTNERVMPYSMGHDVLSDFADKADDDPVFGVHKRCGFWTLDEAAILYNCAKQIGPRWLDIGSHTGWTARYICSADNYCHAIDPMYTNAEFKVRAMQNQEYFHDIGYMPETSNEFFARIPPTLLYDGVVIDGNHDSPFPLHDAQNSAKHLKEHGIILLHDYRGEPIKEAYRWLLNNGFQGKTYRTPNGVAVCWRGEFTPPEHVHDPGIPEV
jgi:hypothetical protein